MSGRERVAFAVGMACGAWLGVVAALYVLPPETPSLLLGAALGALCTVLAWQIIDIIRVIRR